MNDRLDASAGSGSLPEPGDTPLSGPIARSALRKRAGMPDAPAQVHPRKDRPMVRDSLAVIRRDHVSHVVAEDYSYKSEAYYTILAREQAGEPIRPSSRDVLDAFVVPVCLERAERAGIPVVEWGISQAYVPLPAILYGINYFATATDYAVVRDADQAKDVIKHITNKGKYPFCYQKIEDEAAISTCTAVFGRTTGSCAPIAGYAEKLYEIFSLPLVNMVFVRTGEKFALSSLAPTRYTRLSPGERAFLAAYRDHQEFL
ncbi:hypothetical protein [Methanoregula sp.]|uniref:hypothetical protein n=1 Tax=Methanoregula sp. TaxID=2052170 RepID=UPI002C21C5CC|nr:hypothetical protein [Methanoregula sp.]HVP95537.1 hypothetical protein [Methanoregula sp.]